MVMPNNHTSSHRGNPGLLYSCATYLTCRHWNGNVIWTKSPSLAAPEIVILTAANVASGHFFYKITFTFQWNNFIACCQCYPNYNRMGVLGQSKERSTFCINRWCIARILRHRFKFTWFFWNWFSVKLIKNPVHSKKYLKIVELNSYMI